jgi:hypothetical protein
MKSKIAIFAALFSMLFWEFDFLSAQTYISTATVEGYWTKANSPYYINCNIKVPVNSFLMIENGVEVIFTGKYSMTVEGYIRANGVKDDSIYFTSQNLKWKGILFNSSTGSDSYFSHCIIENAGNTMGSGEAAIFTNTYGGGINISGTAPVVISNCNIRKNSASNGGGIYNSNPNAKIINTRISRNISWDGSAIYSKVYSTYKGCLIDNNLTACGGTLSSYRDVSTVYINCTITKNSNPHKWTGIFEIYGNLDLINTIVYGNESENCDYSNGSISVNISYCNIEGGAGSFASENYTSNRLTVQNCMDLPPQFVSSIKNDFRLKASPNVNQGDPNYYIDLNTDIAGNPRIFPGSVSRIDIGAYEYQAELLNYPPIIYPMDMQYILSYSRLYLPVYYKDMDANDQHSIESFSNVNVETSVVKSIKNGYLLRLKPKNNWRGDFYLVLKINDNSGKPYSVYTDSVLIHVGNRFKGMIDSTEVFSDTVKIIGDVTVAASGNLSIKAGAFVEFQDHYKLDVFGKFSAVGQKDKNITLDAKDTSSFKISGSERIGENGWAGLGFYNIKKKDTIRLSYCNINNAGIKMSPEGLSYVNGTVMINKSDNIFFDHCQFKSNYTFGDLNNANCGVSIDSAKNIRITNCTFSNAAYPAFGGAFIHTTFSELLIDSSKFMNAFCEYYLISNPSSNLILRNSYFNNIEAFRILELVGNHSRSVIENNKFIDNDAFVIEANIADTTIIRNNIFIKNKTPITINQYAVVTGNILAYNTYNCNCSNFFGFAIDLSGSTAYVANNTIVGNYSDGSMASPIYSSYSSTTIINNLLWKNSGTTPIGWYNGYNGPDLGFPDPVISNNYTSDPQFSDTIEFRLKIGSGCINKGLPVISKNFCSKDVYGNSRIDTITGKIDIGAVEYQADPVIIPSSVTNLYHVTSVYPNPAKDYLILETTFDNVRYQIFNMKGTSVKEGESTDYLIEVSELENGSYILKFGKNGKFYVAKFLKE